jgi:hypothetical protein
MHEWVVHLDPDLQVTEVVQNGHHDDPTNGPMGVMFTKGGEGCVYDAWTANLEISWKPRNPERTWAYERAKPRPDAAEPYQFYTNAVDELGAFTNLQAWIRAQAEVPACEQNPLTQ